MSTTSSSRRLAPSGAARPGVLVLLAVVLVVGAAAWWFLRGGGPGEPTPAPPSVAAASVAPPPSVAAPSPEAGQGEEGSASAPGAAATGGRTAGVGATAGGTGRGARTTTPSAPPVSKLLGQAETASSGKRYSEAAEIYDQVLKVDPHNPIARAALARIVAMGSNRRFVQGTTTVENLRSVKHGLDGFDTKGVEVKRAIAIDGQLELVMEPLKVKPGDAYAVKVFLRNDGNKPIQVDDMKVSMLVDGKRSGRPLPPRVKEVAPRERGLIEELPGIWKAGLSEWEVEVVVTSKARDVYRNRLSWK